MWACLASCLRELSPPSLLNPNPKFSPFSKSQTQIKTLPSGYSQCPDSISFCRWANEICTDDTEERAIVLATMNTMVGVMAAWLPLIVWQQVDAPQYHKGFITASCMGSVSFILIIVIKLLQDKETSK